MRSLYSSSRGTLVRGSRRFYFEKRESGKKWDTFKILFR